MSDAGREEGFGALKRALDVLGWLDPEDDRALQLRGRAGWGQHHHRGR